MVQTGETVKRQEAFIKGKYDESLKHHVSAIIDDDFCQVVKKEKLQEGDFQVESSMSFGGSLWCRSTNITYSTSIDRGSYLMRNSKDSN